MTRRQRTLVRAEDRGPLKVMFLLTSMPIGGAETLLVNLIRRMNRGRFSPSVCCLKELGPLGEVIAEEIPAFDNLIKYKYDLGVVSRLARLFQRQRIDAIVTVGAGDKMFWGRLAARARAGLPVVLCALHSTGWPDSIGRLNRLRPLVNWTDGFIGVADAHGRHLIENERFPVDKVFVIPNGVDVERFRPRTEVSPVRCELGIDEQTPLVGIVAALRPEKNHEMFLRAAARVRQQIPSAQFLIVGDGPRRAQLESLAAELGLQSAVHFLGSRSDIPELLGALDVFALTSKIEANPVSILEAFACGVPVVAPDVGSIGESVIDDETGYLTPPEDEASTAARIIRLLADRELAKRLGANGRAAVVQRASLERMVSGYEDLISKTYAQKAAVGRSAHGEQSPDPSEEFAVLP